MLHLQFFVLLQFVELQAAVFIPPEKAGVPKCNYAKIINKTEEYKIRFLIFLRNNNIVSFRYFKILN